MGKGRIVFTGLVVLELVNVFNFRSLLAPLADVPFFGNRILLAALLLNVALQGAAVYLPGLQTVLRTTPLGFDAWMLIILVSMPILALGEGLKAWMRRQT